MENLKNDTPIVYKDERSFNSDFKDIFKVYPSKSKDVTVKIQITSKFNIKEVIKLFLSSLGYNYKNNLNVVVLTRNGYVPFDYGYIRKLLDKYNITSIDYDIPLNKKGYINTRVFKSHLITFKRLLTTTVNDKITVSAKWGSCYNHDSFESKCSDEEAVTTKEEFIGWTAISPCKLNIKFKDDIKNISLIKNILGKKGIKTIPLKDKIRNNLENIDNEIDQCLKDIEDPNKKEDLDSNKDNLLELENKLKTCKKDLKDRIDGYIKMKYPKIMKELPAGYVGNNIIKSDDEGYCLALFYNKCEMKYKYNISFNGDDIQISGTYINNMSLKEKRDNLVYLLNYLFGYDENIVYNEFHQFVTDGIFDIFRHIMDNYSNKDLGYLFINQSYNKDDFKENLSEFLTKVLWKMELDLPNDKGLLLYQLLLDKAIKKITKDLEVAGRFIEIDTIYEDSYEDNEDGVNSEEIIDIDEYDN